ncbi:SDR family oxidoreductase [Methylobacterium iners]|uniref:Saccharopine dehydrogenase n=1 Tax=Methylobacterium iners TaxID=418707 RepID=A0ABQ4S037_9HYPH|nr:SDR family oxidoreductase [Methylobacterium iners]GJD96473.1 hypothetical protein OCOJLMKI_3694 [Methylobacterium iners]
MNTVLVLGGYGGFGARLSRRLSEDGWRVLVAGRSFAKAKRLAAELPGAEPLVADRNADLTPLLRQHRPLLLIDAAGPFQGSGYRVAEACIAERVHYIDLADARAFVCAIGDLDERARAAGVAVISGASSVPALSGAVLAELARGMDKVRSVAMSICASNQVTAGASVATAILSYVGKPFRVWKGGMWQEGIGWRRLRRDVYAVEGRRPLRRWVALADVPDYELVPESLPGRPSVIFRAGPEAAFQVFGLWLLSWLVSWGWVDSLTGLSRWLLPLQRLTTGRVSGRSAMAVEVKGICRGVPTIRRWTLVAEDGCGPEVPTLAAQLLARDIRQGLLPVGARPAGDLLRVASFRELFAALSIKDEITTTRYEPLYRRILGQGLDRLPGPVRAMHDAIGDGGAAGTATVVRGKSGPARLIGAVMRFPPEGTHRVHVTFEEENGAERWTRRFSDRSFSSAMSQQGKFLVERFGPLRFFFSLLPDSSGLKMVMAKWSLLGIPLPLSLAPRSLASETGVEGAFHFDVSITLPLIGLIVHYKGRLALDSTEPRMSPAPAMN